MIKTLAVLAGMLLLLQIPKISTKFTEVLLNVVTPSDVRIRIHKITGAFPFDISIDSLKIKDGRDRAWLELRNLSFSWRAVDILYGNIHFDHISVDQIRLDRLPDTDDEPLPLIELPYLNIDKITANEVRIIPLYSGYMALEGYMHSTMRGKHEAILSLVDRDGHDPDGETLVKYTQTHHNFDIQVSSTQTLKAFRNLSPVVFDQISSGRIDLELRLYGQTNFAKVAGGCELKLDGVKSTIPALSHIIGESLEAHFKLGADNEGRVVLEEGAVTSQKGLKSQVDLLYDHPKSLIDVTLGLEVPHMETLKFIPLPISGMGKMKGHFRRSGSDTLELSVVEGIWAGDRLENLAFKMERGDRKVIVSGQVRHPKFTADLSAEGDAEKESNVVKFDQVKLTMSGGEIKASLVFPDLTEADMKVNFDNLSPLLYFLGLSGGGQLQGTVKRESENLAVDFGAKDLAYKGLQFNETTLRSSIKSGVGKLELSAKNDHLDVLLGLGFKDWVRHINVENLTLNGQGQPLLSVQRAFPIYLTEEGIHIPDGVLLFNQGTVIFKGLELSGAPTGQVKIDNVPLSILDVLHGDIRWQGILAGKLELSSTGAHRLKGDLHLKNFGLKDETRKKTKLSSVDIDLSHNGQFLTIAGKYTDSSDSKLTYDGQVTTTNIFPEYGAPIKYSLTGILDISALNGFVWWGDRFKGKLNVTVGAHGGYGSTLLGGKMSLTEGYYENGELGLVLKEIKADMPIQAGIIKLENLSARDFSKGEIGGGGSIDCRNLFSPLANLNVKIQKLIAVNDDVATVKVSGALHLKSTETASHTVSGNLELGSALITLNRVSAEPKVIRVYRTEAELQRKLMKKKEPFPINLDVQVKIPEKLFVQGYGMRSEWKGLLRATGPINLPDVTGDITLIKGHLNVANKKLTLSDSKVSFENHGGELIPVLDITAKKEVRDWVVYLKVSGLATNPKIEFTSNPSQPQEEVISLLIFGKPLSNVTAAQSLQLAVALASIKAGNFTSGIFDSLNKILGVDEIGFNSPDNSEDGMDDVSGTTSLRVGKQLTDKIYVGVDQGLTSSSSNRDSSNQVKALVRVDVTKNTKLDFETGTQDTAVGYNWEKRY